MPKKIEDMVAPNKKSIRDIPIPNGRRVSPSFNDIKQMSDVQTPVKDNFPPVPHTHVEPSYSPLSTPPSTTSRDFPPLPPTRRLAPKKGMYIGGVVGLLAIIFFILSLFPGGVVSYVPKMESLSFSNETYTASKLGEGTLLFSVVKLSRNAGVAVVASGQEQVEEKASGTLVVYNNNSTTQRLIATTRFESADGKVYRIQDAITVPARTTVGGETKPGSLEVVVYADEAGDSYNIGLTDFTLPGLAGTASFETVYARSKTPMSGGFVGMRSKVPDAEMARARADLEKSINDELIQEAQVQVPGDFVLIPSLSSLTFTELPQSNSTDNGVTVNLQGDLVAIMFKKVDLARHLGNSQISLAPGELVDIEPYEALTFAFSGDAPGDLLTAEEITFSVSGSAALVWRPDESLLKQDLAGISRKDAESVLGNYPSMLSTSITTRPFWKRSFPSDVSKITIKRVSEQ